MEAGRTVLDVGDVVVTVDPFTAGLGVREQAHRSWADDITARAVRCGCCLRGGSGGDVGTWSCGGGSG